MTTRTTYYMSTAKVKVDAYTPKYASMMTKTLVWDGSIHVCPSWYAIVVTEPEILPRNVLSSYFNLTTFSRTTRPSAQMNAHESHAPHIMTLETSCQWKQMTLKPRKRQPTNTRQGKQFLQNSYQGICRNIIDELKTRSIHFLQTPTSPNKDDSPYFPVLPSSKDLSALH